jgi:hypothetical protein
VPKKSASGFGRRAILSRFQRTQCSMLLLALDRTVVSTARSPAFAGALGGIKAHAHGAYLSEPTPIN